MSDEENNAKLVLDWTDADGDRFQVFEDEDFFYLKGYGGAYITFNKADANKLREIADLIEMKEFPASIQEVHRECLEMLDKAGMGKDGRPNTLLGMVEEVCTALKTERAINDAIIPLGDDYPVLYQAYAKEVGLVDGIMKLIEDSCEESKAARYRSLSKESREKHGEAVAIQDAAFHGSNLSEMAMVRWKAKNLIKEKRGET